MPFHISEGRFGGAEVQAWLLAKELARRGYDVSYITQSVKGKQDRSEIIDGVNIKWVKYAHHFKWANGLDYYRALKELDPDVVVQRMTSFITGVAGLYGRRHGKKFVWVCTDNAAPYRWHFWDQQRQANRRLKVHPLKAMVFLLNALLYDLSRHWGMKQVTHPFTQNDFQRQALKAAFGLDSFRMISGHEPPKNVIKSEERLRKGLVLWVANLSPRKRPDKFVELARLADNSGLHFVMIGSRSEEDYLDRLFQDKPANLEWLGWLSFDETLSWFDRAAFFVNTSTRKGEGLPNTYVQAWLRGVPVFSLDVDPDEVIQRYGLGRVSKNIDDILKHLQMFSNNSLDAYVELSIKVKEYGEKHHSVAAMADNFLRVLSL